MKNLNNISFSIFDTFIIFTSLVLLLVSWIYIIIYYNELPETIAIHFNGAGEADDYANKTAIWFAPTLFTILTFLMLYGAKNPKKIDVSEKISTEKQAKTSSKTLLFTALFLPFVLIMIVYSIVNASIPNPKNYKWVFPTLLIGIAFFLVMVFIINLKFKNDKK